MSGGKNNEEIKLTARYLSSGKSRERKGVANQSVSPKPAEGRLKIVKRSVVRHSCRLGSQNSLQKRRTVVLLLPVKLKGLPQRVHTKQKRQANDLVCEAQPAGTFFGSEAWVVSKILLMRRLPTPLSATCAHGK